MSEDVKTQEDEKWNWKSKRCLLVAFLNIVWVALLFLKSDVGVSLAPWVGGIDAVWILGESWRPSGIVEGVVRNILNNDSGE